MEKITIKPQFSQNVLAANHGAANSVVIALSETASHSNSRIKYKKKEAWAMGIYFNPETIYKNIFYGLDNNLHLIKKNIVDFCEKLRDEINKNPDPKYKYVVFFNKDELNSFYEEYFGIFTEIGEDIFLSKKIFDMELNKVNNEYDDYIKQSLAKIRQMFF